MADRELFAFLHIFYIWPLNGPYRLDGSQYMDLNGHIFWKEVHIWTSMAVISQSEAYYWTSMLIIEVSELIFLSV